MIGYVIGTFRHTTLVDNDDFFFEKVILRQVPVTGSHTGNLISQSYLFSLRHFAAQCLGSLRGKQRENEQILVKKRRTVFCQKDRLFMKSGNFLARKKTALFTIAA